ncbi:MULTISPECIES: hypothetical protein [unclassified Arsukibacterium]|uniref:hypothetical protein n=1 Tax=unclassified Arsukibacterium TaxID=2635278 RepID=UPI000C50EC3C|nr:MULTISPECIES: hypothetical protein [unclassified Arsukibacterium]MAA94641.1 hypothetical protein [Rheinheimera sp.]MBM32775.1 hypothetical protein [Rheinheimera sp.]HAW93403.1 hypothetical protein [Candidatus Azambacteria bacterium]|tara:strand:+ start:23482 stop:23952 length:471 start_codon:yes stop_codon:yes gene_type:complete
MNNTKLLAQLQQLCELLRPFRFGIGGSCLLWQLGLEKSPNDIDIVCSEDDFTAICQALAAEYQVQDRPVHSEYTSSHFARFSHTGWPDIELMAGIAVKQGDNISRWQFNPQRCHWQNSVCWMPPADWLQLYQLFNRPQRVAQLRHYLVQLRLGTIN